MKTRFLSAALAAMLIPAAATAETETVDGVTYTFTVSSGAATITATDTGDAKVVNIPDTLGGAIVTTLQGGAFKNNTTMQKLIIPETVTNLTCVYISNSYFGPFSGCLALVTCEIPNGVVTIPSYCFSDCSNLQQMALPAGVKYIEGHAFYACASLRNIVLPAGLKEIGINAFEGCSQLSAVSIPDTVSSIGSRCFWMCDNLETVQLPSSLQTIWSYTFYCCKKLHSINIPDDVTLIDEYAFLGCSSLRELTLPNSLTSVGMHAFNQISRIVFRGRPPAGLANADVGSVVYPKEFGALWAAQIPVSQFGGFLKPDLAAVTIVSTDVRENDPTVLDVVYKVTSAKPTVKVRALAFEDGVRSFANVTRPETFIDNTAPADWDAVEANVEHTLSWKVSADFTTDLAKMKFEILAVEDGILPLELTTIPANGTNRAMEFSWNLLTSAQVFDALLWLYADKDPGLTLTDGVLKNGDKIVASGTTIQTSTRNSQSWNSSTGRYDYTYYLSAVEYVFSKMGFSPLTGDDLTYANALSRLRLSPDGIRQYAYRWIDGE